MCFGGNFSSVNEFCPSPFVLVLTNRQLVCGWNDGVMGFISQYWSKKPPFTFKTQPVEMIQVSVALVDTSYCKALHTCSQGESWRCTFTASSNTTSTVVIHSSPWTYSSNWKQNATGCAAAIMVKSWQRPDNWLNLPAFQKYRLINPPLDSNCHDSRGACQFHKLTLCHCQLSLGASNPQRNWKHRLSVQHLGQSSSYHR